MSLSVHDSARSATSREVAVNGAGVRPLAEPTTRPRILVVGYDGSDEARAAFAVAINRSQPWDTITVVHAIAPASSWLGAPYYERAVVETQETADGVLDQLRPIAEQTDTQVEFEVLEGPPADVLIRVAAVRDADEIVVGSRGLGRLRAALGSVSQALLRDAARPVLVVGRDAATTLEAPTPAS